MKTQFVLSVHPFVEVYRPNNVRMAMDLHYYYGDCSTPEAQAQIKHNFIQLLNESFFKEVCQDRALGDKCKAENVNVTCAAVDSAISRRRRSAGMKTLHKALIIFRNKKPRRCFNRRE